MDANGNLYVGDASSYAIRKVSSSAVVTTLTGTPTHRGSTDGTGANARFQSLYGVATDVNGNVYVADSGNNTIRKVTPAGVVTTLAGSAGLSGSNDGTGAAARFASPWGVAVDGAGNVYVADYGNHTIRKITPAGVVATLAGSAGASGSADGAGSAARFYNPEGVAVDAGGNVYVGDYRNHTIRMVTSAGVVTTLAGGAGVSGNVNGTGGAARFNFPAGVAVDATGKVYVVDNGNNTIRTVTPAGVVSTFAGIGSGKADGASNVARFSNPQSVAVDGSGNVYVADFWNNTIRKITPTGVVSTIGGIPGTATALVGGADGIGTAAQFSSPGGIAVNGTGVLYVADRNNYRITQGTVVYPVIALEQPAGTIIANGGSRNIVAAVGYAANVTFTLKNTGPVSLTGVGINIDGTNAADFSVTSNPATTVSAGASTTFVVQFSPSLSAGESAAIHIASNDPANNPFNFNLTGQVLLPTVDTDGDGMSDAAELALSGLNFDWQVAQPAKVSAYLANGALFNQTQYSANRTAGQNDVINAPNTYSLYTLSQVQGLNVGAPLLTRNFDGTFKLTLGIQKSVNLAVPNSFIAFPMTTPQTVINAQGQLEFIFSTSDDAAFFRVETQ